MLCIFEINSAIKHFFLFTYPDNFTFIHCVLVEHTDLYCKIWCTVKFKTNIFTITILFTLSRLETALSGKGSMSVLSMCSHPGVLRSSAWGKWRTTSSRRKPRHVVRSSAPRGSRSALNLGSWSRVPQLRPSLPFPTMWSMISRAVTRVFGLSACTTSSNLWCSYE